MGVQNSKANFAMLLTICLVLILTLVYLNLNMSLNPAYEKLFDVLGEHPPEQNVEQNLQSKEENREDISEQNVRVPSWSAEVNQSLLTVPSWYKNKDWSLTNDKSLETLKLTNKGLDKEEETAWNNFFFETTNGIMLEMGAMNGVDYSVSWFFEKQAKWKCILIDANPNLAAKLPETRPDALNMNVAICDTHREVHFINHGGLGGIDMIVEFMSPGYLETEFPSFLTNGTLDVKKVEADKRVTKIQCLPLTDIFVPLGISHINFLMLDVEGGELDILKAIDFDQIQFDVIAVETDRGRSYDDEFTKKFVNSFVELLTSKGYILWKRKLGRNSWFLAPDFKPSQNPNYQPS